MAVYVLSKSVFTYMFMTSSLTHAHHHVLKHGKLVFHAAAEKNSRECMKLLVYNFKVDPDEPDVVSHIIYPV